MRIIPFLAALTVLLTPALANAQVKPYIEGQIGLLTSISDSSHKYSNSNYTDAAAGATMLALNGEGDTEHDADISFGAEIGVGEIAGTGFRIGVSYSQFGSDAEWGNLSGTVDTGGTEPITIAAALAAEAADVVDDENAETPVGTVVGRFGEAEVTVKVLSLNIYYDFDIGSPMTPYVGLGFGQGNIDIGGALDDDETVVSLHAGANYDINENFYVGARASFHQVGGISWGDDTEESGIDDFNIWTLGVVGGVRF